MANDVVDADGKKNICVVSNFPHFFFVLFIYLSYICNVKRDFFLRDFVKNCKEIFVTLMNINLLRFYLSESIIH